MVDDQEKAIAELKAEIQAGYGYAAPDAIRAIDRAVSISRASQGSRDGTPELVARGMWKVALVFSGLADEEAICISGDDWNQYLPDAEKLIAEHSALSPLATPQAPEDVHAQAVGIVAAEVTDPFRVGRIVHALSRAHLLATPVTVTMAELRRVLAVHGNREEQDVYNSEALELAEALRRVLGDRIQIAGSEGPK